MNALVNKYTGNQTEEEKKADEEKAAKDGKVKPNANNGGSCKEYHWE